MLGNSCLITFILIPNLTQFNSAILGIKKTSTCDNAYHELQMASTSDKKKGQSRAPTTPPAQLAVMESLGRKHLVTRFLFYLVEMCAESNLLCTYKDSVS